MTAVSTPNMQGPCLQFARALGPGEIVYEERQDRFQLTEERGQFGMTEVHISAGMFFRSTFNDQAPDDDLHWGRGTGIILNEKSIPAFIALLSRYQADKAVQEADEAGTVSVR